MHTRQNRLRAILHGVLTLLVFNSVEPALSQPSPSTSTSTPATRSAATGTAEDFEKMRAEKIRRAQGLAKESTPPRDYLNSKWMGLMGLPASHDGSLTSLPAIGVQSLLSQANSIFAIVELVPPPVANKPFKFVPNSLAANYRSISLPLCDSPEGWKEYHNEPAGVKCTGFVVNRANLVTAAHCLSDVSQVVAEQRLPRLRFIRSYWVSSSKVAPTEIPSSEIYSTPTQSLDKRYVYDPQTHTDWAVVELDRPIPAGSDLLPSKEIEFNADERYHSFGFPFGTPMKFAYFGIPAPAGLSDGIANVRLSVFGGNSGAPIINSATGHVAGLLIAVHDDPQNVEQSAAGCYEPTRCKVDQDCKGEMVLPISTIPKGLYGGQ